MKSIYSPVTDEWQKACPKCGNTHVTGVEYGYGSNQRYDGISEWSCDKSNGGCGYREGRWTGFELHDGEIEPRLGQVRVKRGSRWQYEKAGKPIVVGADA